MVTALKIARGASLRSDNGSRAETTAGLTSEALGLQPLIELSRQRTRGFGFESSTPFVVAFRVRKIVWPRGGDDDDVVHRLWTKGASMMDGGESPEDRDGSAGSAEKKIVWLDDAGPEELEDEEVYVHIKCYFNRRTSRRLRKRSSRRGYLCF